jgi:predicted dehydrogenase
LIQLCQVGPSVKESGRCLLVAIHGASHQAARAAIDAGLIGEVVSAHAAITDRGMAHWHPNPRFFCEPGRGPIFDMGPYYIASLVNILEPVVGVTSRSSIGIKVLAFGQPPFSIEDNEDGNQEDQIGTQPA